MKQTNKPEREIRLDKLQALKDLGIDPYPNVTPPHIEIEEVRHQKIGKEVATVGRITGMRGHGKIAFIDLEDPKSKIQLFFQADRLPQDFTLLSLIDIGDYLWVSGELFTTKAGELSILIKKFVLLAKSLLPIPEGFHGLSDVETRYRSRTLDFKVNPEARSTIEIRSKTIELIRTFFVRNGFIEIQTPILQPIPGGAIAKPFVTHYNTLESDFYLRIAPELFLKRLVAGGFERVFEIGPNFRNEGLSHMHNPEFYSVEAYWAYQDYLGFMKTTQSLVQELVKKITGSSTLNYQGKKIHFEGDFEIKKFTQIIKTDTGIDIEQENTFEKLQKATKEKKISFENQEIKVWSELVDELFKKVSRPKIVDPTFVVDFPIELQPLAKKGRDNPKIAEQFQLIIGGGIELVKAYSELNDPLEQERRFKEQMELAKLGWEEAQTLDENYIESLKFGMPPTAGWGLGIERLVMILSNQHSIKEVIPFPTLRPKK